MCVVNRPPHHRGRKVGRPAEPDFDFAALLSRVEVRVHARRTQAVFLQTVSGPNVRHRLSLVGYHGSPSAQSQGVNLLSSDLEFTLMMKRTAATLVRPEPLPPLPRQQWAREILSLSVAGLELLRLSPLFFVRPGWETPEPLAIANSFAVFARNKDTWGITVDALRAVFNADALHAGMSLFFSLSL
jgi:hypothetical protein